MEPNEELEEFRKWKLEKAQQSAATNDSGAEEKSTDSGSPDGDSGGHDSVEYFDVYNPSESFGQTGGMDCRTPEEKERSF
jgi:hypothetical protein